MCMMEDDDDFDMCYFQRTTTIFDFPKVMKSIDILKKIQSSPEQSECAHVLDTQKMLITDWIRETLPPAFSIEPCLSSFKAHVRYIFLDSYFSMMDFSLISSPKLAEMIEEIPSKFAKDVQLTYILFDERRQIILTAMEEITTGKKKNELTHWWLSVIGEKVDEFLQSFGFQMNSLPYDYTIEPPEDLPTVEKNLQILEDLAKGGGEQIAFIQKTTEMVYVTLDPFIKEMEFVLSITVVNI